MAKPKKKRSKQYNPAKKISRYAANKAQKVFCYDGKCYPEMQYNKGALNQPLPMSIKREMMFSVAEDPHHWSIMLLVFQGDDTGKQWYDTYIYDQLPKVSSGELSELLTDELMNRVDACNPKHIICWAWFATPLKNADLNDSKQSIVQMFIDAGAYDREHCIETDKQRRLAEKLEELNEMPKVSGE